MKELLRRRHSGRLQPALVKNSLFKPTDNMRGTPEAKANTSCDLCLENGLSDCSQSFPQCNNCAKKDNKSCMYRLLGFRIRTVYENTTNGFFSRSSLPDPHGVDPSTQHNHGGIVLQQRPPAQGFPKNKATWPQPGSAAFTVSLTGLAKQFEPFLRHSRLDFHDALDEPTPSSWECIHGCGATFALLTELAEHCYPKSEIGTSISACWLRSAIPCRSKYQLGTLTKCDIKGLHLPTDRTITDQESHVLWHFLNSHMVFCQCGLPFDCYVRLLTHQIGCCYILEEEASSPLTFISGCTEAMITDFERRESVWT